MKPRKLYGAPYYPYHGGEYPASEIAKAEHVPWMWLRILLERGESVDNAILLARGMRKKNSPLHRFTPEQIASLKQIAKEEGITYTYLTHGCNSSNILLTYEELIQWVKNRNKRESGKYDWAKADAAGLKHCVVYSRANRGWPEELWYIPPIPPYHIQTTSQTEKEK